MPDIGYYTLPVLVSFEGIEGKVNKELTSKLGVAGKKGGKDFGDGVASGVADGMKAAEQAVERSTKKITQLKDKVANASDAARLAEQKYQEAVEKGLKGSRLTAAANAREKALRAEKAATRDLTEETRRLERAQKDVADGAGMEQGGSSAGGSFLDGFSGAVAAIGTKAGPIGMAITAAGAVALAGGAIIGKQVMAGMEREVAADRMAAQLGLNDTEMARFGQVAGRTYAGNFGESMGDVNEAIGAVASTLGKNAPTAALESMTQKALTFRDVFGTDVAESIALAQNLVVNGLAPDAASAFDAMVTAYQRVPAAMRDELPEILSEYSTFTDSLGFSLEETFGLIVKNAPRGQIAIDKVGDALKEFTLLATDIGAKPVQDALSGMGLNGGDVANNLLAGGDTAAQQFDEIIDGLLRIPDAGQQAAAAIALFGTPLEDLDKAKIPEFLAGLNDADKAMDGVTGSAQEMVDTVGDNTAGSVESARRAVELAMGGMQDSLAKAFGPTLEKVATWVSSHGPEIEGFFAGMGQVAVVAAGSIASFVAETTGGLALVVNAVGDTFGAIATVQAKFAELTGDEEKAAAFREQAQAGFGLADSLYAVRDGAAATRDGMRDAYQDFGRTKEQAGLAADQVGRIASTMAALPAGKQIDISAIVTYKAKDANGNEFVISPDQLSAPVRVPAVAGDTYNGPGRAFGGPITGPGGPTSDVIPIWASNGEHIWTADEVNAVGGQAAMYRLRGMAKMGMFKGFAEGGAIDDAVSLAQSMDGLPYIYGARDCSKVQSEVYAALTGKPTGPRYFTTESDFESLGFVKGYKEGAYNIGVKRGGGGKLSHMAGTLPNGVRFEAGGSSSTVKYGGDAAGAEDFPLKWYLPVAGGDPSDAPTASVGGDTGTGSGAGGTAGSSVLERAIAGGGGGSGGSGGDSGGGSAGSTGGAEPLKEMLGIVGTGLKETFGIGSWLPDIAEFPAVKAIETLMGAVVPMASAYANGSWQPGGLLGQALGTSSAPFGMPNVEAPPMPPAGQHTGSGMAPGPTIIQNVDQSQQFHNSPLGWDPAKVNADHARNIAMRSIPRIPAGH